MQRLAEVVARSKNSIGSPNPPALPWTHFAAKRKVVQIKIYPTSLATLVASSLAISGPSTMHITVGICTFKRSKYLKRTLEELQRQETGGLFTYSIVVADNDCLQSAMQTVSEFSRTSPIPTVYCVEPEQNIALARNKAIENTSGEYVAFIDDDEFPATDWLLTLFTTCHNTGVDGVLGRVMPFFENEPPEWIVRSRIWVRAEHKTGFVLHWRQARTGNVLFRRKIIEGMEEPFLRKFAGGNEDKDFFRRMMARGHVFIWCNEAVVYEFEPPARWRRSYHIKRALLEGQNQGPDANLHGIAKSLVAIPLYTLMLPFLLLVGQHAFMKYLLKLVAHAAKLAGVAGFRPMGDKYLNTE
jgi:succinoglycan biosynthesis protein ExoM